MSVPAGYKTTEVGVIPHDWEIKTLAEVCDQIVDGTHFTPTYTADGVPFYSVENVTANDFKNVKYISQRDHELQNKRCNPEKGDILMTRIGSIADTRLIDWEVKASIYVSLALLKVGDGIDPRYLYAYSRSQAFRQSVENRSLMSAIPKKINMGAIGDVPIPVPPTDTEQKAIAQALCDIDDLIASLDALIAKKRDIKQGAMQQLLTGKRRLPGFSGEWAQSELSRLTDCLDNLRVPLNEVERSTMIGIYPYCGANGVVGQVDDFVLDDDVILLAEDGGYFDEFATRPIAYRMIGKIWVNNHAHILRAKSNVSQGFLFYSLVHKDITPFLASGTRAKLNKSEMNKILIDHPVNLKEQEAIADLLQSTDDELAAMDQTRQKYGQVRQGMMQQLLTGRIRLT